MTARVQVILPENEKELFRIEAGREGISLSAWLRRAAQEKVAAAQARLAIRSPEELSAFFAACDVREQGREPDWPEHEAVIEHSRRAGAAES